MKRLLIGFAILLLSSVTAWRLGRRWQAERADRQLVLMADWSETRECAARLGMSDDSLLQRLHDGGIQALLIGSATVDDYLNKDFRFLSRDSANQVLRRLSNRGIGGVILRPEGKTFRLMNTLGNWEKLRDIEVGFDSDLVQKVRRFGFHPILRVNHDPWLSSENLFRELLHVSTGKEATGFLLNTDEIPGGKDALSWWRVLVDGRDRLQLFFEFRPAKSTVKLALLSPGATWRAHTIASNELKDLTPVQQRARWRRAVEERSCRFLLVHFAPVDTLDSYLSGIMDLRRDFSARNWECSWPKPRKHWMTPFWPRRVLEPLVALFIAICTPIIALRFGLRKKDWTSYTRILVATLIGACVTAALADNALTRIEIVPFRGIKLAFALAWLGSFAVLFTRDEWKDQLSRSVRRMDILAGLGIATILAYVLIRMGNASAAWKPGWEQGVRDHLEYLFVARPRFKEFAVGFPLLLLGLHVWRHARARSFWFDGRFLVGVGMIGPISLVNTFCHLHSPLYLAFWRSLNGIVLGTLLGLLLIEIEKREFHLLE